MVYLKIRPRKRRIRSNYNDQKPWYMRKYNAIDMATKALSTANYVKGLVNVEHKYFDSSVSSPISTTATLTHLTPISQGDGPSSRDGNSVRLKSLFARDNIAINASATTSFCRLIYFIWKDDDAPAASDLLLTGVYDSQLNIEKSDKYKILSDRSLSFDNVGTKSKSMKTFRKLNHHLKFDNTAGTDYESGSIWVLAISNEATNTLSRSSNQRVRYIDN